jgi:uncharacterized membrane protein YoaK (UPF0700 family)
VINETLVRYLEATRRAVMPPPGDRDGPLVPMMLALTVVTGLVDAFSYLVLGHVFVANMTGNIVFLGFALAGSSGFSVGASLTALAAFAFGAFAGGALSSVFGSHRGRHILVAGTIEAILLGGAVVFAATAVNAGRGAAHATLIVVLGVAMGVQNSTARKLAVPDLTTTVLTLTITGVFADARVVGGAGSRIARRTASTAAVFVGATVGALLIGHDSNEAALGVALALAAGVAVIAASMSSRDSTWSAARTNDATGATTSGAH